MTKYWRSIKAKARRAKTKTVLHVVPKRARDAYAGALLYTKAHMRQKEGASPQRVAALKKKALHWAKGHRPENKHHYNDDYRNRHRHK